MKKGSYNFDHLPQRRNSQCEKYDSLKRTFGSEDVIPLWVADMDFPAPPCLHQAIQTRANHPIFGYPVFPPGYHQSIMQWMKKRHRFKIKKKHILQVDNIVQGLNLALYATSDEGDQIITQPPVYPPLFQCVKNNSRELLSNPLIRNKQGHYEVDLEHLEN